MFSLLLKKVPVLNSRTGTFILIFLRATANKKTERKRFAKNIMRKHNVLFFGVSRKNPP
jgi:hypothetical protein